MILSHPQPLEQAKRYLDEAFSPSVTRMPVSSTAFAAEQVKEKMAVIGHEKLAALYDLEILEADIQDHDQNTTRFLLVGTAPVPPSGRDKTTLVLGTKDQPGALYSILKEFAEDQINLTSIFSRPAKTQLGEYVFWIECEGHHETLPLKAVLGRIQSHCVFLKILGSYPRMGE